MDTKPERPRQVGAAVRIVVVAVASPLVSLVLSALTTSDSFESWGNLFGGLFAFLVTGGLGGYVAGRRAALAVGIGLGATWGVIAASLLIVSIVRGEPSLSPLFAFIYLGVAVAAAHLVGKSVSRTR
jgi:hypothetical protein